MDRFLCLFKKKNVLRVMALMILGTTFTGVASDVPEHYKQGAVSSSQIAQLNNQTLNSATLPDLGHPRLYGNNDVWYDTVKTFDALDPDCEWGGRRGIGTIKNIKEDWDLATKGKITCGLNRDVTLADFRPSEFYLTGEGSYNSNRRLLVLYFLRRIEACHEVESDASVCDLSLQDIAQLKSKFIAYEMQRFKELPRNEYGFLKAWHAGFNGSFFDLGASKAFEFWCLFLDTFWGDLSTEDFNAVSSELEFEIDDYIRSYQENHWNIANGNNWTVILNSAALYWVITFYHENTPKARQVLEYVLASNWLHRDFFMSQGEYVEGHSYSNLSVSNYLTINRLLRASFGQPLEAVKWDTIQHHMDWMIESMDSSGTTVDFGDSWLSTGMATYAPLILAYYKEEIGLESVSSTHIDSCRIKDYFRSSYFSKHFENPWNTSTVLARNWHELSSTCQNQSVQGAHIRHYQDYGLSILRTFQPGKTLTGTDIGDAERLSFADETVLAVTSTDNFLPHRETDYGGIIWSAYGNRLLWDFGYGEIAKNKESIYLVSSSKGHFVADQQRNDYLEFYIKAEQGNPNFDNLGVGIGVSYRNSNIVRLTEYLQNANNGWQKAVIPLSVFANVKNDDWLRQLNDGSPADGAGTNKVVFKAFGGLGDVAFGIDEIRFVANGQASRSVVWYGDSHRQSISPNAVTSTSDELFVKEERSSGGANGSQSYAVIKSNTAGRSLSLFYNGDFDERIVKNYIDKLPLGANTLILPDEVYNADRSKHKSQIFGRSGTSREITLSRKQGIHLDGSEVYGSSLEGEGALDYFNRYAVPLDNGTFILIDSFRAKQGHAQKIQEFFYTKKDDINTGCQKNGPDGLSDDVAVTILEAKKALLKPKCNQLKPDNPVESVGLMLVDSMSNSRFKLGAPDFLKNDPLFERFTDEDGVLLINRLGDLEHRRLLRYEPEQAVTEDVRVFLLVSATSEDELPQAAVQRVSCDGVCFNYSIGSDLGIIELVKSPNDRYVLNRVSSLSETNDDDGDGIINSQDNCRHISNPGQEDLDMDGLGDLCDLDQDGDGIDDNYDSHPRDSSLCGDFDTDGKDDCSIDAFDELCFPIKTPNQQRVAMVCL